SGLHHPAEGLFNIDGMASVGSNSRKQPFLPRRSILYIPTQKIHQMFGNGLFPASAFGLWDINKATRKVNVTNANGKNFHTAHGGFQPDYDKWVYVRILIL